MYSLHDAIGDVDEIVARAKELGYDAIALTDHSALYGVIEFYEAAKKAGVKPIIGVEVAVAPHKHTDKRSGIDNRVSHLTIIAETNEGYKNLLKLISKSYLEGFYYVPRIDKELLREHGQGLIVLSGCMKGDIPRACQAHDLDRARELIATYRDILGSEQFFLELVHHPESPTQSEINELLIQLSQETGTPLVATKDVHYLHADDREAQDVLVCIHDGKLLDDQRRSSSSTIDLSMSSPEEMIAAFQHVPEAIENTRKIADRCTVEIELGKNHLPEFVVPEGETENSYLRKLCETGLALRYPEEVRYTEAKARMEFELATIERMGFAAYFLIVQDYIVWAKEHSVIVGPGRGSAAGSVVAYALKITNLDPLRYGLLFERFLNPDRISMPDIDTDFDDAKRADVIKYVTEKYGLNRVAGIITFGTMAARAAVRDVGRVLGLPYSDVDRISKVIPPPVQGKHVPLETSIKEAPELRAMYETDPRVKRLIDLAIKLEGTTRHASQHACGIVITPKPLVDFCPLQKAQGGDVDQVVQYAGHSAEAIGLLKMDFLGLSNLSIIRDCFSIVEAVYDVTLNVDDIPLDDAETFALLGRGDTTGVFQLESEGMKKYIRELKPTAIEDIIAMVALYRPGPMQFIESFIARKHGRERVSYIHPLTENALKNTYGIPVYQEQVMQVSKDMAGFTPGEADTLRKAMGKKIAKLMAELKVKFIEGSVKNGVPRDKAEAIFQQFEEFAAYGFNKSHAACYALIAYQTAYLKAHYPDAFMAALLNSDCQNIDRITIEVEECRHMGLPVLAPDVNESYARFSVIKGKNMLRFGLLAIKGLGEDIAEFVIKERKANGPYKDLTDFVKRMNHKSLNRRSLDVFVRSGALDCFGDRNQLYFNIESILEYHKRQNQESATGQFNLFSSDIAGAEVRDELKLRPAPPAVQRECLIWEKELLGLYLSAHPFQEYADRLKHFCTPIALAGEEGRKMKGRKEKQMRIAGLVTQAKKIVTKANEPMVFMRVEDMSGDMEVVVFPRTYKEKPEVWEAEKILVVSGRPQEKDGEWKLLAETAYEVTPDNIDVIEESTRGGVPSIVAEESEALKQDVANARASTQKQIQAVTLTLRATLPETILLTLRTILDKYPGHYSVYFAIENPGGKQKILSSYRIAFNDLIAKEVEGILGADTVRAEV